RGATAVAAVSPSFFPYLRDLGATEDQLVHVPNWTHVLPPDLDERARLDLRREMGWAEDEIVALHAGNMGHKQHLAQVLAAARLADAASARVRFALMGDGNQRSALQQQAAAEGIERVQFLPPQPDERFMSVLAAADVLLVTERSSVQDMALPSKLTSYAVAGRPVVAAVNDSGATAAELRHSGMALVEPPEDPGALLGAVQRLGSDHGLTERLVSAGRAYAAHNLGAQHALDRDHAFVELVAGVKQTRHIVPQAA
ncbi:MAG: glycosyltransferase, partial [Allosphingosinicella sp.]